MKWSDKIEVFNEDNLKVMARYPDNYFDLAIVDPEYGINIGKMNFTQSTKGGIAKRNDYSKISDWDKTPPNKKYFDELFRVSKNQIIWGWNYFVPYLDSCKCYIVWDKKTEDKYSNDFADCETAWTSFNRPAMVYRYLWSGMLQSDMKNKEKRIHPTQKPVNLYMRTLRDFAKEGDKILDTNLGSGSHAIACQKLGFEMVATETNKDIFDKSYKWFRKDAFQSVLF